MEHGVEHKFGIREATILESVALQILMSQRINATNLEFPSLMINYLLRSATYHKDHEISRLKTSGIL